MPLLRRLIRTICVLLVAVFGTVAAFAAPYDWSPTSYPIAAQKLDAQPVNLAFAPRAPPTTSRNLTSTGNAFAQTGGLRALDGAGTRVAALTFDGDFLATNSGPRLTIRDHYNHHNEMRADVIDQLKGQGYKVADGEASFGSACGIGRCRPDILYEAPNGTKGIIEIEAGNADLSIRQTEIFPQIENGNAIPSGNVAARFGLRPGVALKDQGYPNGIPIEVREFPGARQ